MTRARTLIAVGLLLCAVAARGESRWSLGGELVSSTLGATADDAAVAVDEQAPGGGFQLGYRLSADLLLRIYVGGAEHPTSDPGVNLVFAGGTLDLCRLFRRGAAFRPYVFGGLGGFALESDRDAFLYEVEGVGAAVGAGFFHRLGRRLSLHGNVRYDAVNWDTVRATLRTDAGAIQVETPVDDSGSAVQASLGLVFHL